MERYPDNKMFGDYNLCQEKIVGDWSMDFRRDHHLRIVCFNGISFFAERYGNKNYKIIKEL